MRYPGGKNGAGTYQRIVNQIPPHHRYVEAFVGSGAVLRAKRPAAESYALDLAPDALDGIRDAVPDGTRLIHADAIQWLGDRLGEHWFQPTDFVYLDPPYLMETRRSGPMYRHELTDRDHRRLLAIAQQLPCMVMISGYWSELYAQLLQVWRTMSFEAMTRGGCKATEWLWMNYPEPIALHDYRYLGENFREREKIGRQRKRWVARLRRMDVLQRRALLAALAEYSIAERGEVAGRAPRSLIAGNGGLGRAGQVASVLGGNGEWIPPPDSARDDREGPIVGNDGGRGHRRKRRGGPPRHSQRCSSGSGNDGNREADAR